MSDGRDRQPLGNAAAFAPSGAAASGQSGKNPQARAALQRRASQHIARRAAGGGMADPGPANDGEGRATTPLGARLLARTKKPGAPVVQRKEQGHEQDGIPHLSPDEQKTLASALADAVNATQAGAFSGHEDVAIEALSSLRGASASLYAAADGSSPPDAAAEDQVMDEILRAVRQDIPAKLEGEAGTLAQAGLLEKLSEGLASATMMPKVKRQDGSDQIGDDFGKQLATDMGDRSKLGAFKNRVASMAAFYRSMCQSAPPGAGAMIGTQAPVSPQRQAVVAKAMGELGKTRYGTAEGRDGSVTDVDDNGKPAYAGWRNVMKYFAETHALPKVIPDQFAHKQLSTHWCGIFSFWAAGWDWPPHNRTPRQSKTVMVGDIVGAEGPENHHGVVSWVDPAPSDPKNPSISTVEGNQNGGEVTERTTSLSIWNVIYDLDGVDQRPEEKK